MPLSSYIPRSDSFGNWYFGGVDMQTQVEPGYGVNTSTFPTQTEWNTFLTAALGSTNWAVNGNSYYFRFPVPYEPLTGQVTTTNYRFAMTNNLVLNTKLSGAATVINVGQLFTAGSLFTTAPSFAVVNQLGIWMMTGTAGTPGTLSGVQCQYIGWLKNPVFPTNDPTRIRNAIIVPATLNFPFSSAAAEGSATVNACYPPSARTCAISTPGANITDIAVINTNASNLCLGTIPNSLIYHGSSGLNVGQLYRIPPAQDPDGNTEQNIWLCCGSAQITWNGTSTIANNGYRLVRIWSNNII